MKRSKATTQAKPKNLRDVLKGIKATWDDPASRKKILRKALFRNLID